MHCVRKAIFQNIGENKQTGKSKQTADIISTKCDFATARRCSLSRHIKEVHNKVKRGSELLRCDQCDYISSSAEVSKHKMSAHPEKAESEKAFKCDICDNDYAQKSGLLRHVREVHDQIKRGQIKCDHCDYISDGENVVKHMRSAHHKKFEYAKNFKCDRCDYATSRQIHLDHHIKGVHDKIKDLKCDQCEFATAVEPRLRRHIMEVHDKQLGDIIQCDQCDYRSIKRNLFQHKRSSHGEKNHKCKLCNYACRTASYLSIHVKRVHEKQRNHKCEQCNFSAFARTTLLQHIKAVHENMKDFKCDQCQFQTSKRLSLLEHKKAVHDKVKDLMCEDCDFAKPICQMLHSHISHTCNFLSFHGPCSHAFSIPSYQMPQNHTIGICDPSFFHGFG